MKTKVCVTEPLTNRHAMTTIEGLSDLIYGLNWSLKAKGYLSLRDYKDILANMLGINIPTMGMDSEIRFVQHGDENTFFRSDFHSGYDEENKEFITFVNLMYRTLNVLITTEGL